MSVGRYRHGHEMLHGNGNGNGKGRRKDNGERDAGRTENLRQAMVDFRAVFEQLVEQTPERDLSAHA